MYQETIPEEMEDDDGDRSENDDVEVAGAQFGIVNDDDFDVNSTKEEQVRQSLLSSSDNQRLGAASRSN